MRFRSCIPVAACLASGLVAQRTWIVDASNGPGTDYTRIQPAVDAATPGDTIRIRAGGYATFDVSEGLRILAAPGVSIRVVWTGSGYTKISVHRVPAGQTLVLRGFRVWSSNTQERFLEITDCLGDVHLDSLFMDSISPGFAASIYVLRSRAVTLYRCDVRNGIDIDTSAVTATESNFDDGGSLLPPGTPVNAVRSSVTLASCSAEGGWFPNLQAFPAVSAFATQLRLLGTSGSTYKAGSRVSFGIPAVAGDRSSRLELDPRVTLVPHNNAPSHAGFGTVTTKFLPVLTTFRDATLGNTVDVTQLGVANEPYALWLSLPTAPVRTPAGELWIDAARSVLLTAGVHTANGIVRYGLAIPNAPILRGLPIAWQGLGGPLSNLAWTNAVVTTVH